jgi:hypothetical protein
MSNKVTVLLPGGFKPPHMGHVGLANKFASRGDVEKVLVLVGPTERDGVTRQQSLAIWKMLPLNPKVQVVAAEEDNPMNAAFGYVFNLPKDSTETVALGASAKSPEDAKRSKVFAMAIDRYKTKPTKDGLTAPQGVRAIEMTDDAPTNYAGRTDDKNGKSISASTLRGDLANGDVKNFATSYPGVKPDVVKRIYSILTKKKADMDENKRKRLKAYIAKVLKEDGMFANLLKDPKKAIADMDTNINAVADRIKRLQDLEKRASGVKK